MNDEMLEGLMRSRLRARAPHDVPATLLVSAAAIPETARRSGRLVGRWQMPGLRLQLALVLAIVVVVIAGTSLRLASGNGTAAPVIPTLPPMTQPSLPPAASHPTRVFDGAWVSPTVAWVVDANHALHMTEDGGLSWSGPRPLPHDDLRGSPAFLDASFGYAMWAQGDSSPVDVVLYLTRDGGRTWSPTRVGRLPSDKGDENSLTAHFVDPGHGIVLAGDYRQSPASSGSPAAGIRQVGCAGWSTDDGGRTWATLPNAPCSDHDLWASPAIGIIYPSVDGGPRVSLSVDGGRSWRQGSLPGVGPDEFPYVAVVTTAADGTPRIGYWVVKPSDAADTPRTLVVAETRDLGASWQAAYATPIPALGPLTALGPDLWLASGVAPAGAPRMPEPILETADGGRTWSTVGNLGTIDGQAIGWLDRLHGMASGQDDSGCALPSGTPCRSDGFFLTNDGGLTWHGLPF